MNWTLIIFGFLLHLVLFYSIFDIYFTSPIIHGVPHHSNPIPPPAKRLVLFSADGLRADKLFELHSQNITHTPFLRSVMEGQGRWGVSHTRVPTESRPGHVALIAGFYEDVSAVAKGWKENPVEFDSVFNQSSRTFAWGSPDILPMFAKGSTGDHVVTYTYPGESEDFAGIDLTKLDTWVFDNFKTFLEGASLNRSHHLHSSTGVIFFLHLLGLDTTGHVHKPHSQSYVRNLKVVDAGVKAVVQLVEDFFGHDARTAYIFTSDHGMTDWGSHGAGLPSETQTPLLVWGAGIQKSLVRSGAGSDAWDTSLFERSDVMQADVCPLMSVLIGLPIALQSVGIVPVELLDAGEDFKAHSVLTNVKQLYEQYKAKRLEKKACTLSWLFSPYKNQLHLEMSIRKMEVWIEKKEYGSIMSAGRELMQIILEGFLYYHNYERTQLGLCVCLSYMGWMLYVAALLLQHNGNVSGGRGQVGEGQVGERQDSGNEDQRSLFKAPNPSEPHSYAPDHQSYLLLPHQLLSPQPRHQPQTALNYLFILLACIVMLALYVQSRPPMHFIYFSSPLLLWYLVFSRWHIFAVMVGEWRREEKIVELLTFVVAIVTCLEIMIFSFMCRELFTLVLLGMAVWACFSHHTFFSASCLVTSIFPLLPTLGKSSNYYIVYASCVTATLHFSVAVLRSFSNKKIPSIFKLQALLIPSSGFLVWWFETTRASPPSPTSFFNMHIFSWCILASSFVLPLFSARKLTLRLLSLCIAFCAPTLLLSLSHESFFYVSLCVLLYSWLLLETGKSDQQLADECFGGEGGWVVQERKLGKEDVRRACFYLFFLLLSFFGTGNIASVNSFDPSSILPFVSVFNPFVMGGLIVFKILALLQLVSFFFQAIQVSINIPPYTFFLLLLIISDFMACHFFFMVKDQGSWLEIGTSISHYVIIMSFIIFFFILLTLSKFFTHTHLDLKEFLEKFKNVLKWIKSAKNTYITNKIE